MKDIIHLLPDSVANQIAAGEVVQRPASVIKELLENAIDAGATKVEVALEEAGKNLIQVVDDGKGMSETDARLAFERHATSKISTAADLYALTTMGFRGEALASIAAVAQVELRTRPADNEVGTSIHIEGGKLSGQEPVACPVGANFMVRNLFYNVPARRKFLKSNQTELNNIIQEFERVALVNPSVSLRLQQNGTELFNLPSSALRQRIVNVFGRKLSEQLLPVEVNTTMVNVTGFVGKPEAARKKGAHQYFFVNGRYMRHPYFHKAVMGAYDNIVPAGEQVPYFLYLTLDPSSVDVNIHPTKTEIKFENEPAIWQILQAATKETLGKCSAVPMIDFDNDVQLDIPVFQSDFTSSEIPVTDIDTHYDPFKQTSSAAVFCEPSSYNTSRSHSSGSQRAASNPAAEWDERYGVQSPDVDLQFSEGMDPLLPDFAEQLSENASAPETSFDAGVVENHLQYFQYKKRYILTSVKSGLLVIHQHRAHLRILYDDYLRRMAQRHAVSQRLLFPEIIELSAGEQLLLPELMADLQYAGFELSDFGGGSYAIHAVPEGTENLDPVTTLREVLTAVADTGVMPSSALNERIALSLARQSALPEGRELTPEEMEGIVSSLFNTSLPGYTPDGKTIQYLWENDAIDAAFK